MGTARAAWARELTAARHCSLPAGERRHQHGNSSRRTVLQQLPLSANGGGSWCLEEAGWAAPHHAHGQPQTNSAAHAAAALAPRALQADAVER